VRGEKGGLHIFHANTC